MSSEIKRAMISWAYPGDKWLHRVLTFSPERVHAVHQQLMNSGKLNGIKEGVEIRKYRQPVKYVNA